MNLRAVVLVAACTVAFAPSVSARASAAGEQVRVTFGNGRVTVIADNATLGEILQEWARVGGSHFVNAEKIPSTERLTLRLENQTEVRALEVLLRGVPGYMAVSRAPGMPGASSIGKVMIMPVSQAGSFAQVERPSPTAPAQDETPVRRPQMTAAPPRPDDDGPTRQTTPPPPAATLTPMTGQATPVEKQTPAPAGQSSPLGGTQTQTVPGFGATSQQPGAVIPMPRPGGGRPIITPTQPRPGGGGG